MDPNFLEYLAMPQDASSMEIKEELYEHTTLSLISPPITPAPSSLPLPRVHLPTSRRKGSLSSAAGSKRHRPYPQVNIRSTSSLKEEVDIMSNPSPYGSWNHSGARTGHASRPHPSVERRTSDGEDQSAGYNFSTQFMHTPQYSMGNMQSRSSEMQSMTSSSSLTGAIGDANIPHSRQSRSPASSHSGSGYNGVPNNDLSWNNNIPSTMTMASMNTFPGVAGHGGMPFGVNNPSLDNMAPMNEYTNLRNMSPGSTSPHSPPYTGDHSAMYAQPSQIGFVPSMNPYNAPQEDTENDAADEIRRLRRRVAELEQENARARVVAHNPSLGLPSNPPSAVFQRQWRQRTDARIKKFCSLNRAGNALCSWHDSRRERRAHPPRNAPPGRLNCGCTYEEALFEESLARHQVGSYLPGESVRMDPALRNPLLRLLQQRYNYKDGDFDHDPLTETWNPGESPEEWVRQAQSSQSSRRRQDNAH